MNRLDTLEQRLAKLEGIIGLIPQPEAQTELKVNDLVITHYFKHPSEECTVEMYTLCGKVGVVTSTPNYMGLVSVRHGHENWNWPVTACIKVGTNAPIKRGDFVLLHEYAYGEGDMAWSEKNTAFVDKVFEVQRVEADGVLKVGGRFWPESAATKVSK